MTAAGARAETTAMHTTATCMTTTTALRPHGYGEH
jgi:hypothetical protein